MIPANEKRTLLAKLTQRTRAKGVAPRRPRSPSPPILTTEQQERAIALMLRDNAASRRAWQCGFALLCLFVSGTCAWLAHEQSTVPFEGPAALFAPLERSTPGSTVTLAIGLVALAVALEGVGFAIGSRHGCYVAVTIGAAPAMLFAAAFWRDPRALASGDGWSMLWVPATAPALAGLGLYCEAAFDATARDIHGLGELKYAAHTA